MKHKETFIKDDQYYILASSSYTDDRVRVLNYGNTFGVFDRWGDIKRISKQLQGIYHEGTRFVSDLEFRVNDHRPVLLSSTVKYENESQSVDLTNPDIALSDGSRILKGSIHIGRNKFLKEGVSYEVFHFQNFNQKSYDLKLSFAFDADFRDIFEVRGIARKERGLLLPLEIFNESDLKLSYTGLDHLTRATNIHFSPKPERIDHKEVIYNVTLAPQKSLFIYITMVFQLGEQKIEVVPYQEAYESIMSDLSWGKEQIAHIYSSNEQFNDWINRSKFDLLSLLTSTPYGKYPYAGVPWYNTVFGRDGIITALETLWIDPEIARGVLRFLAYNQSEKENSFQDAEPGKILHELRSGEMAEMGEIPFKRYYGTVDATPLFLVLAGKYFRRTADEETITEIWPQILNALKWIDTFGDLDKDGFVEYQHKEESGLTNQGWKDSHDSVSHKNGDLAEDPIALCEVQGYVYEAKMEVAFLAHKMEDAALSDRLIQEAQLLKKKFNEKFWDEELGSIVLALDKNKKPCRVKSTNAGHCLFSGIVDEDKAGRIVESLLSSEMYSGWGIRTLAMDESRYNPMSYHNGSVWPHDTAMVAFGMSRYGFKQETLKIMDGLFNAAIFIDLFRMPELFCGFSARRGEAPTAYPVACSPQAWSVAAVFFLLQACLQIEIDAISKKVRFSRPVLPNFVNSVRISNLMLGKEKMELELFRFNSDVGVNVLKKPEDWNINIIK
ncbi:amylo-alpha-1,6-glucosidase [Xanthovirga aplysinae]|uniref:amylo-alpha-1,6-glucosidase n=1 Tax=Xanthovirga aplysinae TaxID=2529853 RepID=UPI0012BC8BE8|nr:amylo-alpha-1,6-glucosidase [Xanthovirga aplysinae]MTI31886.1 amylo-alpha-1,6-glucosidase [Xanthovirga aplysinae]